MGGIIRRAVAYNVPLKLLRGKEFISGSKTAAGYVELNPGFKVSRVSVWGNVVSKFLSEKEFGSITLDDFSGSINLNVFKENRSLIDGISHGDVVEATGKLRADKNNEICVAAETIVKLSYDGEMLARAKNLKTFKNLKKMKNEEIGEDSEETFELKIEKNVVE